MNTSNLEGIFEPKSIAVIGASSTEGKIGNTVLKNLVESGYKGAIYPINPKASEIYGYKAYPSVLDTPEVPDLGVMVIPYKVVPGALRECGERGVPAVVIITAGFRESGKEGVEREREVIEIAKQYNIRIIGPNVLGIIDTYTPINATFAAGTPPRGTIAFMSQSGALQTAILDWSLAQQDLGFSKFVSLGNKADINENDLMLAWADDPDSHVILSYVEGVPNGQEFIRAYRGRPGPHAPVIVLTAASDADEIARDVSADDVLTKPFDLMDLIDTVAHHTSRDS